MNWLRRHFARVEQLPPGKYLVRVGLETFGLSLCVLVLGMLLDADARRIDDLGLFIVSALFIAPWLETALFQWVPIAICRRLGAGRAMQIGVSLALFAVPHFVAASLTGFSAGLVGGFYFAFTYTTWRRHSAARAYWMTTAHHALYNGLLVALVVVLLMFE
jgi:hypothetical protein